MEGYFSFYNANTGEFYDFQCGSIKRAVKRFKRVYKHKRFVGKYEDFRCSTVDLWNSLVCH